MVTFMEFQLTEPYPLDFQVVLNCLFSLPFTFFCYLECQEALGMEKRAISDGQISASSQLDANHEASQGRLNLKGSWSAYANDAEQWLQIDLGTNPVTVTRVATQGINFQSQWVINYTLKYSDDGLNFQLYKQQGQSEHKVRHPPLQTFILCGVCYFFNEVIVACQKKN